MSINCPELESMKCKNEKLKLEIMNLQEQLNSTNSKLSKSKKLSNLFDSIFYASQQQAVLKGRCFSWLSDDSAKAVTLHCISYKTMGFVRGVLK